MKISNKGVQLNPNFSRSQSCDASLISHRDAGMTPHGLLRQPKIQIQIQIPPEEVEHQTCGLMSSRFQHCHPPEESEQTCGLMSSRFQHCHPYRRDGAHVVVKDGKTAFLAQASDWQEGMLYQGNHYPARLGEDELN
jgi:hypothetical protein